MPVKKCYQELFPDCFENIPKIAGKNEMAGANDKLKGRQFPNRLMVFSRIGAVLFGAMLVTGTSGCMLAALPLAISAAEGVGSAVANVTLGAVVAAHQKSGASAVDPAHPGESEGDRWDRCQELQFEVPAVIELHKNAAGAPEYRELQLGGSQAQPQWTPIVAQDTDPGGWRPAVNFLHMDFTPPLGPLPSMGSDYLAYRPMESDSSVPQVEFSSLNVNFGKTEGTFRWNGSLYQYALAFTLPCFPAPR